jgi:hypothetical protein
MIMKFTDFLTPGILTPFMPGTVPSAQQELRTYLLNEEMHAHYPDLAPVYGE